MREATGSVVSLNTSAKRGVQKKPVPEIVIDDLGIAGDAHAGPWHRQVSVLAAESIDRFVERTGRDTSPGEFAENITTRGVDLLRAAPLDTLALGGAVLEVTQIGKECRGDACAIFREVGECTMPTEGIFCRTVTGGTVRAGDAARLEQRPFRVRVITMSDRASRGDYEDLSGPRVEELLREFLSPKRWHESISRTVLSDDAAKLEAELRSSREAGVDVVLTTGGTGVGPRDLTPDVVTSMADKTIPGIMEQVRTKYGAENPRALLSRSVAAVMGTTLVYTLPGSARAVEEYAGEILKTLEHLVFTLHGLDVH